MREGGKALLHITVLSVGTIKEAYLTSAIAEYEKRLLAYAKVTMKSCKEEPLPDHPTDAQIRGTIEKEGERLLAQIPPRAYVVALCVEGKQMPSEAFAKMIDTAATSGYGELVFIIGGSYGLSDAVKRIAQLRLFSNDISSSADACDLSRAVIPRNEHSRRRKIP